jgi:hypothetical protein
MRQKKMTNEPFSIDPGQGQSEQEDARFFSWGKLIFLGIISLALCNFGPLSIFAPVPLSIAILLYGFKKSAALALGCLSFLFLISLKIPESSVVIGLYVFAIIYSLLIIRVITAGQKPVEGIMRNGGMFLLAIFLFLGVYELLGEKSIVVIVQETVEKTLNTVKTENVNLLNSGTEQARILQDLIEKPKAVTKDIFHWAPAAIFSMVFLSLWASLLMVLRNALIWKKVTPYPYSMNDLIKFRMPYQSVWVLIVGLVLTLAGDYTHELIAVGGVNILYCLGVFYFFSGLGVFLDLLTHIRFFGFIRTFTVIFTIFLGWQLITLIGVFDTWFNFRKFFKRKNDEGDIL